MYEVKELKEWFWLLMSINSARVDNAAPRRQGLLNNPKPIQEVHPYELLTSKACEVPKQLSYCCCSWLLTGTRQWDFIAEDNIHVGSRI